MASPKKSKTPTESKGLDEFFSNFEISYKPFVQWFLDKENDREMAQVRFISDKPESYTNKWNREQWKIEVMDEYDSNAYLSGGKRLFQCILRFCKKHDKLPTELGIVEIYRLGKGFETNYKMDFFQK